MHPGDHELFELTPEQRELQRRARELSDGWVRAKAAEIDRSEAYPWDTVDRLREHRLLGMTIPRSLGGLGLSYFDAVLVIEQLARNCGVTARIVVEANMGAIGAVLSYGTEEQKRRVASLVLSGDKPAICITEPNAGSAATEMSTTATRSEGGYVLNGCKHWITGGGVSRTHLIFARVRDGGRDLGIGGFLAFRDESRGLVIAERQYAMGLRGIPEAVVRFDDLFVPDAWALPSPSGYERGFASLMNAYNGQRVGAAGVAHGIAQGAFELAVAHVKRRRQFGRPLAEFQGLQWMLADMQIGLNAARSLIYLAARSAGSGFPDRNLAAQAKVFAAENAIRVTNDALQLFGARGYGRDQPLERMARDARMFTIGGGTAQVLRNQVAGAVLDMKLPQTRDGYLDRNT
jgi:hypothetical protein